MRGAFCTCCQHLLVKESPQMGRITTPARLSQPRLLARPGHSRVDLGRPGGPVQIALGEHVRFSALFQIGAVFG